MGWGCTGHFGRLEGACLGAVFWCKELCQNQTWDEDLIIRSVYSGFLPVTLRCDLETPNSKNESQMGRFSFTELLPLNEDQPNRRVG